MGVNSKQKKNKWFRSIAAKVGQKGKNYAKVINLKNEQNAVCFTNFKFRKIIRYVSDTLLTAKVAVSKDTILNSFYKLPRKPYQSMTAFNCNQ